MKLREIPLAILPPVKATQSAMEHSSEPASEGLPVVWMRVCLVFLPLIAWVVPLGAAESADQVAVRVTVLDETGSEPVACRMHLADASGKPVRPPQLPFWKDAFVCPGKVSLLLSPGRYRLLIDRGPEYYIVEDQWEVTPGQELARTYRLRRLVDLKTEHWYSGETHVHRPLEQIELLMRAEDLHVTEVITWWNNRNRWKERPLPADLVVQFDKDRFYNLMAGEDERGGGALMYFGLREPLPIAGSKREYPPMVHFLHMAKERGAWVEIEKPFWWDVPVWLATEKVDSVGIAHNHFQRGGMLDSEAWGRPRDRQRYPGPLGLGYWTQQLYYHILNCGFRLPPAAGSASGVLANPLGYNRTYAYVDREPLDYKSWWDAVRAGRVFVTNGPLLRVRAGGHPPGYVFRSTRPVQIRLEGRLDSRDPIERLEIVRNGYAEPITLPTTITIHHSGWFLLRAVADVPHTFRFASTGPWYVEIEGRPRLQQRSSARLFLDWVRQRIEAMNKVALNEQQKAEVLGTLRKAEQFWGQRVEEAQPTVPLTARIVDAQSGEPLAARVYIQRDDGRWFFAHSPSAAGSAIRYERQNWINKNSIEYHTTVSVHGFKADLPPGRYTITVERGKEYFPLVREVQVGEGPLEIELPLRRWVNMAARGWYSGDTHVHRSVAELRNVAMAEDVNVTFPLTAWVTRAGLPATKGDKNQPGQVPKGLIQLDPTHVIWPRNTEYEIFSVAGHRHTLGAFFVLGHSEPLPLGVPPVGPVGEIARQQGALIDLDKHDWPWSMMLVPVLGVNLYELANNHHWRTEFGINRWSTPAPAYMSLANEGRGGSEYDWTLYTMLNYYALLDCGFHLVPTAGTANGVHPVPLGFSRVYVHLPNGFEYQAWITGLKAGRSFVTTGPMLIATANRQMPGHTFTAKQDDPLVVQVAGTVISEKPVQSIELIVNGRVAWSCKPQPQRSATGAYQAEFDHQVTCRGTSWIAVRCWEPRGSGRIRFAHTGPWWIEVPGKPLRPPREELEFLADRVRAQIGRNKDVLSPQALEEYHEALRYFQALEHQPRPGVDQ